MTDCILWQGATSGPSGYGMLMRQGRKWLAHRHAWELRFGPIPAGMNICHHCDVRLCINTDHLFMGTQRENMLDAVRKGRVNPDPALEASLRARRARIHCKRGHLFDGYDGKQRTCKKCAVIRTTAWYKRRKARLAEVSR